MENYHSNSSCPLVAYTDLELGSSVFIRNGCASFIQGRWRGRKIVLKQFLIRSSCTGAVDSLTSEVEAQRLVEKEYQVLSSLVHPYIVRCYGAVIDSERGCYGLVLETLSCDLCLHLLSPPNGLEFMEHASHVAQALRYMHATGVCHRDIKSQNIFLDASGKIRVCEFGQSSTAGDEDQTSTQRCRSTLYTAPEAIQTHGASACVDGFKADVYSFGALLWHLAEGCVTSEGRAFVARHSLPVPLYADDGDACCKPPMSAALSEAPLGQLIMQCMADTPGDRPCFDKICRDLDSIISESRGKQVDVSAETPMHSSMVPRIKVARSLDCGESCASTALDHDHEPSCPPSCLDDCASSENSCARSEVAEGEPLYPNGSDVEGTPRWSPSIIPWGHEVEELSRRLLSACMQSPIDIELVGQLVKGGADPRASGRAGSTALHWAVRQGDVEVAALLLDAGARVDASTNDGFTALNITAFSGTSEMASILLERGASVAAADNLGRSPLHWAAQTNNVDVACLLLSYGADLNALNDSQETPLDVAIEMLHSKTADLLRTMGAVQGGQASF